MSINRVQKLLFSEYCDFEDLVLIESPFAQTTKDGTGLRQVHLGLTPSKLILATDTLPPLEPENVAYNPFVDPEIDNFELIAIYPVECVNLSVYRKRRRQAIKARFCNNRVWYFELGGFERRGMFWNLWCEKIKFLCPSDSGTSRSETSVATSTTGSSLYLLDRKMVTVNGIRQLWCKFGPNVAVDTHFINEVVANNSQSLMRKWTDRYLYLGKDLQERALDYKPKVQFPFLDEFVKPKSGSRRKPKEFPPLSQQNRLVFGDSVQVNRFGSGIMEGCNTGLYLTFDDYVVPRRYSSTMMIRSSVSDLSIDLRPVDYDEIAETAVLLWEFYGFSNTRNRRKTRHRRRYGFAPKPLFLYGLGPWQVSKGDTISLQLKRAVSDINLSSSNNNVRLPVSRRQLFATISCPLLSEENKSVHNNIINVNKKPVIFYWTPGYWYRPITAKDAYKDLQKHLKKIRQRHEINSKYQSRRCNGRRFLRKFSANKTKETDEEEDEFEDNKKKRKHSFISNILGTRIDEVVDYNESRQMGETSFQYLKRILKLDVELSAWDFDSNTLAQQLTMIDKELFLKIPTTELDNMLWQQSAKNAPNVAAFIGFSYRISCLIASEILKHHNEKIRARLMARFINVANKCHRLSNFQSCRSVLGGLQNPAIFRLRRTWAYVRKKHSSKYQAFEFLCRLYRDPRMPSFQKTFFIFSQHPPYLPYIGHLIAKLFDKLPEYRIQTFQRPLSRQLSICTSKSCSTIKSEHLRPEPNLFIKLLSVFSNPVAQGAGDGAATLKKKKTRPQKSIKSGGVHFRGLYEYFRPLDTYRDDRREKLQEVRQLLEKCQLGAVDYCFSSNETAKNFLLKARHMDDQDNFFKSLSLESSPPNSGRNRFG